MAELFDVADATPCPGCQAPVLLTEANCASCEAEMPTRERLDNFMVGFLHFPRYVDGRPGGLVLGRHTPEDDIHLFYGAGSGVLQSDSDMHGGEYIVNAQASTKHFDRLVEINSFTSDDDYEPMKSIPLSNSTLFFIQAFGITDLTTQEINFFQSSFTTAAAMASAQKPRGNSHAGFRADGLSFRTK